MATPHINAEMGDFADVVLMPGDPLRAKYIAETFLEDAREVNNVRGMLGFTGTYKGRKISVMGHGMGIPSCSIYTKELITDFGVKKIIRVGSCGAVLPHVKLRDVVIGMGACTDSKVNRIRFKDHDFAAIADFDMVRNAVDAAKALGIDARVGNLFSADLFYSPDGEMFDVMEKYQPECLIVWGNRLWDKLPGERWTDGEDIVVDGCRTATGTYSLASGRTVRAMAVNHPSVGYSLDYWHRVIANFLK